jgi:hypothetical protein
LKWIIKYINSIGYNIKPNSILKGHLYCEGYLGSDYVVPVLFISKRTQWLKGINEIIIFLENKLKITNLLKKSIKFKKKLKIEN